MQGGGSACVTHLNQRCLETSQPSARVIQISYDTWGLLTQPISEFWEGLGLPPLDEPHGAQLCQSHTDAIIWVLSPDFTAWFNA